MGAAAKKYAGDYRRRAWTRQRKIGELKNSTFTAKNGWVEVEREPPTLGQRIASADIGHRHWHVVVAHGVVRRARATVCPDDRATDLFIARDDRRWRGTFTTNASADATPLPRANPASLSCRSRASLASDHGGRHILFLA